MRRGTADVVVARVGLMIACMLVLDRFITRAGSPASRGREHGRAAPTGRTEEHAQRQQAQGHPA